MDIHWVDRTCPLCNSSDQSRVLAESNIDLAKLDAFSFASRKKPEYMHPRLIECAACGMLYASPVLSMETLISGYQSAHFDSGSEASDASLTYATEVAKIVPRLPDLNGSLDIGTGDGAFLTQLLRLGFQNVLGIEPSEAPRASASPELRQRIRQGTFRAEDYRPGQFSLVTCFQTLEHVPNPLAIARDAFHVLKPGGAFAIVVHNRKAASARILGFKSPIYDIEHLQLFDPRSARRLLQAAEFTGIEVSAMWNRYSLDYWSRLMPMPNAAKTAMAQAFRITGIGRMRLAVPAGNLIVVGYKQ
jgi:SAM-dependent methyltransferase